MSHLWFTAMTKKRKFFVEFFLPRKFAFSKCFCLWAFVNLIWQFQHWAAKTFQSKTFKKVHYKEEQIVKNRREKYKYFSRNQDFGVIIWWFLWVRTKEIKILQIVFFNFYLIWIKRILCSIFVLVCSYKTLFFEN